MDEACACGGLKQLTWSPLFSKWLCPTCLWQRTEAHLKEPVTALPVPEPNAADGALASGGYLGPHDTCYLVGEHGPEAVVPNKVSTMLPCG